MRYIAFLRAINVGGRVVKMAELRRHFEAIGLTGVETVIASGNVVFETRAARAAAALERRIEAALEASLGYAVGTFVRTTTETADVAAGLPFGPGEPSEGHTLNVAFLREPPAAARVAMIRALSTDNDRAEVVGREAYWLRYERGKPSEQFAIRFGRALGAECTVRNVTTVRRIADRYCGNPAPRA